MLLGEYFARTGDLSLVRLLWPNVVAALTWIDTAGGADRDGIVVYRRRCDTGLTNEGWKDSAASTFRIDCRLAGLLPCCY
jgi:glycogen debranching enzyme